jgi:hypothetical protein
MSWIPGWGSVASAEWWSGFYFWLSISCLIGLGITEVASHRYGERKDELAAIEQATKDKRHDEDVAHLQHDTAQANERAAELSREAAQATQKAAEANARAAQAELGLQKMQNPRTIDFEKLKAELAGKPKGTASIMYVENCTDCEWLAHWILAGLRSTEWALANEKPVPLRAAPEGTAMGSPAVTQGGQPWGVSLVANTQAEGSPESSLRSAFLNLLGRLGGGVVKELPDGFVRVIVAPRP